MSLWSQAQTAAAEKLIDLALAEDLGERGDITSLATVPADRHGTGKLVARADGVLAGLPVLSLVFHRLNATLKIEILVHDGDRVSKDQELAKIRGSCRAMLAGERTALNFLQRLSGVATQTRRYAEQLSGLQCKLLDTRKTTPGWRVLEKYAVRCGGGTNHRQGLFDVVMIKDNHLTALGGGPAAVTQAVAAARKAYGHTVPIEVEVDWLGQLTAAFAAGPDIILLDNFTLDHLHEAVALRNITAPGIKLEASGGVTLATLRQVGETGVDFVSVGALTHSAVALDLALDFDFAAGVA